MSAAVTFNATGGATASGELAAPDGTQKSPAVVLIQEWWGVNDHLKAVAAHLADAGFLVLAPDLYHGKIAKNAGEAKELMTALDPARAMDEISGAVAFLAAHPQSNAKVGVVGFCMGGAFALGAACAVSGISAVVPFYGLPPSADYARVTAPILGHFAKKDDRVTPERVAALKKELDALGKSAEFHTYDADHAFFNDTRREVFDAEAAKLAWDRTLAFLRTHLA